MNSPRYFDIIPPAKLRVLQKLSSAKKRENNLKRHQLAYSLYKEEGIESVMHMFHVGKEQAYKMIRTHKEVI